MTSCGDVEAGLAGAAARVDVTYTTPVQHNNPAPANAPASATQDTTVSRADTP